MLELLHAAVELINLPFTVLLGLILLYWLLIILGVFGLDTLDSLFDVDLDSDVQVDTAVEPGLDGQAGPDQAGGFLRSFLHFLNVGQVPVMAVWSVLILCLWTFSILANHYFNPEYLFGRGLLLLLPNILICLMLTHFLTWPLRFIFRKLNQDSEQQIEMIGQVAKVITGEVTESFGEATIDHGGVPIRIHVRLSGDQAVKRGDLVLVIEEDPTKHTFKVVKYKEPQ